MIIISKYEALDHFFNHSLHSFFDIQSPSNLIQAVGSYQPLETDLSAGLQNTENHPLKDI